VDIISTVSHRAMWGSGEGRRRRKNSHVSCFGGEGLALAGL
jgi:hypothetical protein